RIALEFADLRQGRLGQHAPRPEPFEPADGEVALRALAARLLTNTEACRQAGAPLAFVPQAIGQSLSTKTVEDVVLPFAGLAIAVLEFEHPHPRALAVGDLADIGRAVVRGDPFGILQARSRSASGCDARFAGHGARRVRGFLGLLEDRTCPRPG